MMTSQNNYKPRHCRTNSDVLREGGRVMKRPTGLTVFAVLNFVFAGLTLLAFVGMLAFPMLLEQSGQPLNAYAILSPTITSLILIMSGIGFLKVSYRFGFVGGLILCIGSLTNFVVYNALRGFEGFAVQLIGMIYPTVLLLFLLLKYKRVFIEQQVAEP